MLENENVMSHGRVYINKGFKRSFSSNANPSEGIKIKKVKCYLRSTKTRAK